MTYKERDFVWAKSYISIQMANAKLIGTFMESVLVK